MTHCRSCLSGHSHHAATFLSRLGVTFKMIGVELSKDGHKALGFSTKKTFGQIRLLAGLGCLRLVDIFNGKHDLAHARAPQLLSVMDEHHRTACRFLAGTLPTTTGVAFHTYTAQAPLGRMGRKPYPAIRTRPKAMEPLSEVRPSNSERSSFGTTEKTAR